MDGIPEIPSMECCFWNFVPKDLDPSIAFTTFQPSCRNTGKTHCMSSRFPLYEIQNQGFLLTMGLKGLLETTYINTIYGFGIWMVSMCSYTYWAIFFGLAWVREKQNVKMTWSTNVKMTPSTATSESLNKYLLSIYPVSAIRSVQDKNKTHTYQWHSA